MGKYDYHDTTSNSMLLNNLGSNNFVPSTNLSNSPQTSSASSSIEPTDECSNEGDMSMSNYYHTF